MKFPEALNKFLEENPSTSKHQMILDLLNVLLTMREQLKPEEWKGMLRVFLQSNSCLDNIDDMYRHRIYGKSPVVRDIWKAKQEVCAFKRIAQQEEIHDREEGVFHMEL